MSPAAALVFRPGKPHLSHTACARTDPHANASVTQLNLKLPFQHTHTQSHIHWKTVNSVILRERVAAGRIDRDQSNHVTWTLTLKHTPTHSVWPVRLKAGG